MIKKPLNKIAELSPGLATASAQANLSAQEKANMAAFAELRKTHDYLTTLPQNEAYRSFNALPGEYRDALNYVFDPKYQEQDKGFFGNFIGGVKSSLWYSTSTVIDFGKQIIGMETGRDKKVSLGDVGSAISITPMIGAIKGTYAGAQKSGVTTAVGSALETALRPQIKTIKQPYTAQKLAEIEGEGTLGTYGKFIYEGFKELLPGGRDALPTDNSKTWKKYWEQAADRENVFDRIEVEKVDKSTTPEMAFLGKILAKKGNFFDYWEEILADPAKLDIVNRYSSGKPEDQEIEKELGKIVAQYSNAKISPGRDLARNLFNMFPFQAEKALAGDDASQKFFIELSDSVGTTATISPSTVKGPIGGDGVSQKLFSAISGTVDTAVTFLFDPIIIGGKVKRSTDAARFGLIKMGEDPRNLEKAWKKRTVRKYWDNLGNLFQKYQSGTIAQKADVLTRITERYPEISTDVALYMAPNIKDADTALKFFVSGDIVNDMMRGNAGIRRTPLIPRYSVARSIKDWTKDAVGKGIGIERYRVGELPESIADIAKVIEEGPNVWAEKLGFIEDTRVLAGRAGISEKFKGFVAKDRSVDAILDRAISRQLSIAPKLDRMISLDDASSADQVYRLARTVIDKHNASVFRIAWIGATEGERLLMYKGLLKTMGVGMGFDLTENGRKFLDNIDVMSKELYSVNQSALNLDEFTRILRTTTAGEITAPEGIRKIVDQVTETAGAEGIASRLAASTGAEMREMIADIKEIKDVKKGLLGRKKAGVTPEEAATIDSVVKELDKSLAIMGGMLYKTKMAKKIEIEMLYGDVGYAKPVLTGGTNTAGGTTSGTAIAIQDAEWAPGIWAGSENMPIEIRDNSGVLKGFFNVVSVNMTTKVVNVDVAPGALVASDIIWHKGAYGNEFIGIHKIVEQANLAGNILFNINTSTYNLFKGNVYSAQSGALSFSKLNQAVSRSVEKGLEGKVTCLVNPRGWANMLSDQAALRKYDGSYSKKKLENGSEALSFFSQNGEIEIIPSIYVKEGYAYLLSMEDFARVGSTDITFKRPGADGNFFRDLENASGYELRCYTDQAVFCAAPGKQTLINNIVNQA